MCRKPLNRRFIVVEGIYANTGELAPLDGIKALKEVRGAPDGLLALLLLALLPLTLLMVLLRLALLRLALLRAPLPLLLDCGVCEWVAERAGGCAEAEQS